MRIVFWNFFNLTIHLFNEPSNCSNHELMIILTKTYSFCDDNLPVVKDKSADQMDR